MSYVSTPHRSVNQVWEGSGATRGHRCESWTLKPRPDGYRDYTYPHITSYSIILVLILVRILFLVNCSLKKWFFLLCLKDELKPSHVLKVFISLRQSNHLPQVPGLLYTSPPPPLYSNSILASPHHLSDPSHASPHTTPHAPPPSIRACGQHLLSCWPCVAVPLASDTYSLLAPCPISPPRLGRLLMRGFES